MVYMHEMGEIDLEGHDHANSCDLMTHTGAPTAGSFVLCSSPWGAVKRVRSTTVYSAGWRARSGTWMARPKACATSPQQQSQRKQAFEAVSHKGPYEAVGTSLIDILPGFLQIDPLAKHMLEQITAPKANLGMSGAHPLWS